MIFIATILFVSIINSVLDFYIFPKKMFISLNIFIVGFLWSYSLVNFILVENSFYFLFYLSFILQSKYIFVHGLVFYFFSKKSNGYYNYRFFIKKKNRTIIYEFLFFVSSVFFFFFYSVVISKIFLIMHFFFTLHFCFLLFYEIYIDQYLEFFSREGFNLELSREMQKFHSHLMLNTKFFTKKKNEFLLR